MRFVFGWSEPTGEKKPGHFWSGFLLRTYRIRRP